MSLSAYLYPLREEIERLRYEEILLQRYILFRKAILLFVCK